MLPIVPLLISACRYTAKQDEINDSVRAVMHEVSAFHQAIQQAHDELRHAEATIHDLLQRKAELSSQLGLPAGRLPLSLESAPHYRQAASSLRGSIIKLEQKWSMPLAHAGFTVALGRLDGRLASYIAEEGQDIRSRLPLDIQAANELAGHGAALRALAEEEAALIKACTSRHITSGADLGKVATSLIIALQ